MKYLVLLLILCIVCWVLLWSQALQSLPSSSYLPHRPLHEIDVQGHKPDTETAEGCRAAGRMPDFVPESGEFLHCWSGVTQGEAGTTYSDSK